MAEKGVVAVLDKPGGKFDLRDYPLPEPAPGTVLVKQELTGVCGTDIHMYHGHLPGITYPICLGHEFMGRIAKLGKGVTTDFLGRKVAEGDRVIVAPGVGCGKCYWCLIIFYDPSLDGEYPPQAGSSRILEQASDLTLA